jgi:hypothetical protein
VLDRLVVGGSKSAAMKKMLIDQVRDDQDVYFPKYTSNTHKLLSIIN